MTRTLRSTLCTATLTAFIVFGPTTALAIGKVEYSVVDLDASKVRKAAQLEALLNKLGAEGWELVETNMRGMAVFKRIR